MLKNPVLSQNVLEDFTITGSSIKKRLEIRLKYSADTAFKIAVEPIGLSPQEEWRFKRMFSEKVYATAKEKIYLNPIYVFDQTLSAIYSGLFFSINGLLHEEQAIEAYSLLTETLKEATVSASYSELDIGWADTPDWVKYLFVCSNKQCYYSDKAPTLNPCRTDYILDDLIKVIPAPDFGFVGMLENLVFKADRNLTAADH